MNSLADGGINNGIGASSANAANLVFSGAGGLIYNSSADANTNRLFTFNGTGTTSQLLVNRSGAMNFTNTGAISIVGGAKTLLLSGTGTGNGSIAASIGDGTGATSIQKGTTTTASTNTWSLTNENSAFTGSIISGTTTVAAGTLAYASAGGANLISFLQTTGSGAISYIGATDKTMSGLIQANALSTGAITLDSSGAGAVNYSNTGSLGVGGASGAKGLVLSGINAGNNILAGSWNNNTAGGAATLTKNGTGKWTLSGTHGYTGATAVNQGTLEIALGGSTHASSAFTVANAGSALIVNGTVNGTLTANASTTISGSGTINGAATINGNLNPGNSPGLLTFGSSLTMSNSTATTMEINGTTLGLGYDSIDTNGALTYDGILTLAIGATFGSSAVFDLFDFGSQTGSFDSVTLTGNYAGPLTNNGFGVWSTTTNMANETWSFSQATGDLTLTVVPEPNAALLLGSLGTVALLRRRR